MTNNESGKTTFTLPEYRDNPFIARLPQLLSQKDALKAMASYPIFDECERTYPAHLRKHCIMRLCRYFEPMERQNQLDERLGMILRQGYVGRDPLTHDYIRHLHNGVARIEAKSLDIQNLLPVENTANSFALIGGSGNGKSKSIEKVLHQYPQYIHHSAPFSLIQIVWLNLECPHNGSLRQLCINFFSSVDKLIGSNYYNLYGRRGNVDEMMGHMAHVANLHALGVLVIDEIQHLNKAKVGPDAIMNFLVKLVNTIGVPVILIGTLSAAPLLQENFRQARRSSGLGSLVWERIPKGKTWDYFINKLWKYQWTHDFTPIDPNIRAVLYDESQGIIDIVIKLFILAQFRVIRIGEVRGKPEVLTPNLLRTVAREDFRIIQPMIHALRTNDRKALLKFDDLRPLQEYFDQAINTAMESNYSNDQRQPAATDDTQESAPAQNGHDSISAALRSLGIADDVAQVLITDAIALHPSGDPLLLMSTIVEKLAAKPIKPRKPKYPKKAEPVAQPDNDLRRIVALGKDAGHAGYEALLAAGMIKPLLLDIAA